MDLIAKYHQRLPYLHYHIKLMKERNGSIRPPKILNAVEKAIEKIVIWDKTLKHVESGLRLNKYLTPKDRKLIMKIIRSAFPKDYFRRRQGRKYYRDHPTYLKGIRNDKQILLSFKNTVESEIGYYTKLKKTE